MSFRDSFLRYTKAAGQEQLDFLDSIDFSPYLIDQVTLDDIKDRIEVEYPSEKISFPLLKGDPFNIIDDCELASYLEERYPYIHIEEQISTWYEVRLKR